MHILQGTPAPDPTLPPASPPFWPDFTVQTVQSYLSVPESLQVPLQTYYALSSLLDDPEACMQCK